MRRRCLIACAISAVVAGALGFGLTYWQFTHEITLLQVMDEAAKVRLNANLLRQLERSDAKGAERAHRELIKSAGIALDVLAPRGSRYDAIPEVTEARRTAETIGAEHQ